MKKVIAVLSFVTIFIVAVVYAYFWPFEKSNTTSSRLSNSKETIFQKGNLDDTNLKKVTPTIILREADVGIENSEDVYKQDELIKKGETIDKNRLVDDCEIDC